jgi:hypothetical protein
MESNSIHKEDIMKKVFHALQEEASTVTFIKNAT